MKILAVDTSTASGSIALMDGLSVKAEWILQSNLTHNRLLLKNIHFLLTQAEWALSQVDAFAVTTGPGSFTGLRIGLTTMKTLAWTMKKPYLGIPSLDALAAPFSFCSLPVCCLIDARKHEVYGALYRPDRAGGGLLRVGDYRVLPPERMAAGIQEPTLFCGDGWLAYRDIIKEILGEKALEAPGPCHVLRADFVAELARVRFEAGEREDPLSSVPLYVRPSDAELHHPPSHG
ncbi:tRNA (adenosine(37)-N6)-threonylcarbamoyltransferase complex dimerization subunit type 1 TsaB [Desulforhabdus sp. TSK]|uniref:tRNA (adenosine(37)-N6)-threonylcarbamoyltransferase complex dimerization subunit type 1 TsaB n=1 Tax=Desulforhabdus sp. TSK TaxID=2925014 RepID=UPI001FC85FC1|nr:tRNA (adenosine(37)-N6)-threonylcarbamoyltransferase complex dimerization subunit type 1 TsaB [Desulforhabdus sp. TSK]GKT09487.1 tRNA (adenosine(37)-N6)-threonylcarbamoyltransferase complex dimerization subunit type 1 TsaB [Desulforhabdus sp. TSK]